MAKGLSQITGLAVVVALALAAVFGAMSLTNPALAQDEPDAEVTIYQGLTKIYDANAVFAADEDITFAAEDQDPSGVVTVDEQSGDDAGKFNITRSAALGNGVRELYTELTFKQDHDNDGETGCARIYGRGYRIAVW